jgi:TfoX/Sxy family transcriptional regulator of competence genes
MAYDEALAERIRDALHQEPDVIEKKMFGGLCFLRQGNMVCGVVRGDLMVRVGKEAHEHCLALPHAREMDFTKKRRMTGMLYVGAEGIESDQGLAEWVERCLSFTRTLPPK